MSLKPHEGPFGGDELRAALALLDLAPPVSWSQIRAAYREKSRRLHPDRNPAPDADARMAEVAAAYKALEAYVTGFRYAFTDDEYFAQRPRERVRRQFGTDSETWRRDPRKRR